VAWNAGWWAAPAVESESEGESENAEESDATTDLSELIDDLKGGEERECAHSWKKGLGEMGWVVAGSDNGGVWVFDRLSTLPVAFLHSDEYIVNAVRPNPFLPFLAASGIESTVKIWGVGARDDDFLSPVWKPDDVITAPTALRKIARSARPYDEFAAESPLGGEFACPLA